MSVGEADVRATLVQRTALVPSAREVARTGRQTRAGVAVVVRDTPVGLGPRGARDAEVAARVVGGPAGVLPVHPVAVAVPGRQTGDHVAEKQGVGRGFHRRDGRERVGDRFAGAVRQEVVVEDSQAAEGQVAGVVKDKPTVFAEADTGRCGRAGVDLAVLDIRINRVVPDRGGVVRAHRTRITPRRAEVLIPAPFREALVVVLRVHHHAQGELLDVGKAGRGAGLFTGLCENREEDSGEDRDDRDHHQKFDQGKTGPSMVRSMHGLHSWERADNGRSTMVVN